MVKGLGHEIPARPCIPAKAWGIRSGKCPGTTAWFFQAIDQRDLISFAGYERRAGKTCDAGANDDCCVTTHDRLPPFRCAAIRGTRARTIALRAGDKLTRVDNNSAALMRSMSLVSSAKISVAAITPIRALRGK